MAEAPISLVVLAAGRNGGGTINLLANVLSNMPQDRVALSLIDFRDGFLSSELRRRGVSFELRPFEKEQKATVRADEVFLASANSAQFLRERIVTDPATRVLLWQTHPEEFVRWLPINRPLVGKDAEECRRAARRSNPGYFNRLRYVLQGGSAAGGLIAMDQNCRDYNKVIFELPGDEPIVPVCTDRADSAWIPTASKKLRLTWLGRLTDFKTQPVIALYEAARALAAGGRPLMLNIVGDGDDRARLEDLLQPVDNLDVVFHGHLEHEALTPMLTSATDIGVGHGMSLVEFARLGVPSLMLEGFYFKPDDGARFNWLFDRPEGDVGVIVRRPGDLKGVSLSEALDDQDLIIAGQRSFTHWAHNFDPEHVANKVLHHIISTRWTVGRMRADGFDRFGFPSNIVQAARQFYTRNKYW